ncbi:MAG: hypothetical protein CM15mP68_0160 [Pseudomonadota bacterium]|nr:MAG: hypothetical protein CM15mP68_0160 [Pseudomonadota bacterium]
MVMRPLIEFGRIRKGQGEGLDPAEKRCRIEHCSILHDEQIPRCRSWACRRAFLIGHVHYWGKAFVEDIFGPEKAAKLTAPAPAKI